MLYLIGAGICVFIGCWIASKITYTVDANAHMIVPAVKEKVWPQLKKYTPRVLASSKRVAGKGLKKLIALKRGA